MDSSVRDILTAVREGRLDPAEAIRLLDTPDGRPDEPADQDPPPPAVEDTGQGEANDGVNDGDHDTGKWPERESAAPQPPGEPATDDSAVTVGGSSPTAGTDDTESGTEAWAAVVDDPGTTAEATSTTEVPRPAPAPATARTVRVADALSRVDTDAPATTTLRLRAMTRRVRVIADPAVATVSVDGPHELRREGSTLVLESDRDLPFGDPFAFLPAMRGGFRLQPGQRGLPLSFGSDLVVRLNPSIALDVDVTAGSLSVRGVPRVRARVTAGSARIEEMTGPLDLHVVGGTAKVDMTARGATNRIRCESGSITLRLRKDSDVRLRPDAQLGRITIDGAEGAREIVVGAGTGRLDVEIVMGNLQVEVEQ